MNEFLRNLFGGGRSTIAMMVQDQDRQLRVDLNPRIIGGTASSDLIRATMPHKEPEPVVDWPRFKELGGQPTRHGHRHVLTYIGDLHSDRPVTPPANETLEQAMERAANDRFWPAVSTLRMTLSLIHI